MNAYQVSLRDRHAKRRHARYVKAQHVWNNNVPAGVRDGRRSMPTRFKLFIMGQEKKIKRATGRVVRQKVAIQRRAS